MSLSERADALEEAMVHELNAALTIKSAFCNMADGKLKGDGTRKLLAAHPGKFMLMGEDPRLPQLPPKPTIMDFYRCRLGSGAHLLQSAAHARAAGLPEKTVAACLMHDIAVAMFIRVDHGYWGAQLLEPYVDEEISWAIRAHQALRFYPDASVGYEYPESYRRAFGEDYQPDAYVEAEYQAARKHPWYMTARMITVFDIYSFDPNKRVALEEFEDVFARHFRQPEAGLGYDGSPVAHMWRTIAQPTKSL